MADYALNRVANSLVSNDRDNQGKFTPVRSMAHVAGENNYYQHGKYLFGCGEGDLDELEDDVQLCQVIGGKKSGTKKANASSSEPGTETEEQTNRRKLPSCPVCKKNAHAPNDFMLKVLAEQIRVAKEDKKRIPADLIRSPQLISPILEDYQLVNVYHYFPNRAAALLMPGLKLTCWNGSKCAVPEKTERKKKENVVSKISENKITFRAVEGLDGNAFVIIPEFYCSKCEQTKAASDSAAMEAMGVPLVVLRTSGFVFLEKIVWTGGLYRFVTTSMTGRMGAEQIEKTVAKMYMDRYLMDGVTFMEAQLLLKQRKESGASLECYGYGKEIKWDGKIVAWPPTDSHCEGGLGRLLWGPLKTHISEVFLGGSAMIVRFASAIEASIGGTTSKGDGNYSIPKLIVMDAGDNQLVKPTCLQASKNVYVFFRLLPAKHL